MPATRIEVRSGWLGDKKLALIEAVQRALQSSLKLPDHDRCIRLTEYDAESIITPTGKGPFYLVVEITLFSGRSEGAKRQLYSALANELSAFDIPASDIKTILIEVPSTNWGIRGLPASDLDLGYKIDV